MYGHIPTCLALNWSVHPRRNLDRSQWSWVLLGQVHGWLRTKTTVGCAMVTQLQTQLPLRAGHQPGRRDPLRNLSQVHPRGVEGLQSQGKYNVVPGLQGGTEVSEIIGAGGWSLFSWISFPLAEIIWQLKINSRWCSVPLLEAAHHSKLFPCFIPTWYMRTGSSSYDNIFGEMQHMQNVPSIWFKRYNKEYPLTDKEK